MSLQAFAKHFLDIMESNRITELNRLWNIKPTPHGTIGLQQSLRDRLQVRLAHLLRISKPDVTFLQDKVLHIKLSGDGTNIGKRLHIINFTFTLLEEGFEGGRKVSYSDALVVPVQVLEFSMLVKRNTQTHAKCISSIGDLFLPPL